MTGIALFVVGAVLTFVFLKIITIIDFGNPSKIEEMLSFKKLDFFYFVSGSILFSLLLILSYVVFIDSSFLLFLKIQNFNIVAIIGAVIFGLSWGYVKKCPMSCAINGKKNENIHTSFGIFLGIIVYQVVYLKTQLLVEEMPDKSKINFLFNLNEYKFTVLIIASILVFLLKTINSKNMKYLTGGAVSGVIVFIFMYFGTTFGAIGSMYSVLGYCFDSIKSMDILELKSSQYLRLGMGTTLILNMVIQFKGAFFIKEFPNNFKNILAGLGLGIGSLLAGGCTSGAMLAGLPTLSLSSWCVTIVIFFTAFLSHQMVKKNAQ